LLKGSSRFVVFTFGVVRQAQTVKHLWNVRTAWSSLNQDLLGFMETVADDQLLCLFYSQPANVCFGRLLEREALTSRSENGSNEEQEAAAGSEHNSDCVHRPPSARPT
jgi:hypothetical protein